MVPGFPRGVWRGRSIWPAVLRWSAFRGAVVDTGSAPRGIRTALTAYVPACGQARAGKHRAVQRLEGGIELHSILQQQLRLPEARRRCPGKAVRPYRQPIPLPSP
eukprot:1009477-Pyramimonas_sp.AAC.1